MDSKGELVREISKMITNELGGDGDNAFDRAIYLRAREVISRNIDRMLAKAISGIDIESIVKKEIEKSITVPLLDQLVTDKAQKMILRLASENIRTTMNEVEHQVHKARLHKQKSNGFSK